VVERVAVSKNSLTCKSVNENTIFLSLHEGAVILPVSLSRVCLESVKQWTTLVTTWRVHGLQGALGGHGWLQQHSAAVDESDRILPATCFLEPCVVAACCSGVAWPLAARGGGQICRPFFLGFGKMELFKACKVSIWPNVISDRADDRHALIVTLCFYCTQTQFEFSREFFNTIFARLPPLASAARCDPASPRYATDLLPWRTSSTRPSLIISFRSHFVKSYSHKLVISRHSII